MVLVEWRLCVKRGVGCLWWVDVGGQRGIGVLIVSNMENGTTEWISKTGCIHFAQMPFGKAQIQFYAKSCW